VDAVSNARGLECMCVNGECNSTPHARVMYLETKRVITHIIQGWINSARYRWARAIGFGEGRGPTWPLGSYQVDGGQWNAWVCACANHTRPTHGTRRDLGLEVSKNAELVNTYRQTPHKSPHEESRMRRVGMAAQLCRNIPENKIFQKNILCLYLTPKTGALDAHWKGLYNSINCEVS
jgi:hypothetical protein